MGSPESGIPRENVERALAEVARFREASGIPAADSLASSTTFGLAPSVFYVVGSPDEVVAAPATVREFPVLNRKNDEMAAVHLVRVVHAIDAAIGAGGTHLLIPKSAAEWLIDHPLVEDYLTRSHELLAANEQTGIVFALRR